MIFFNLYLVTTISLKIPNIQNFKKLHHTAQKSGCKGCSSTRVHNKSRTQEYEAKENRCNYLLQEEQM